MHATVNTLTETFRGIMGLEERRKTCLFPAPRPVRTVYLCGGGICRVIGTTPLCAPASSRYSAKNLI